MNRTNAVAGNATPAFGHLIVALAVNMGQEQPCLFEFDLSRRHLLGASWRRMLGLTWNPPECQWVHELATHATP
jgi:hypothetical protein